MGPTMARGANSSWPLFRYVFVGPPGLMNYYELHIINHFTCGCSFVLSARAKCLIVAGGCLMCSLLLPSSVFFVLPHAAS